MNTRRAFVNALILFMIAGALWAAPPAEAVVVNHRSIGTQNVDLFNAGTASVGIGQAKVTFAGGGRLPDTVGRGDEIVIDDEELYILSRDSDTEVTLQEAAQKEHADQEFGIRRAYTSIQAWVNDRNGNLVREDRLEVGICYNDGPFTVRKHHWELAHIRGSKTDPEHFMWLTAAETAQHKGAAGTGVVLDGLNRTRCGILIEDDYTRVDGLELKNFGPCHAPGAVVVRHARGVILERLLIHDFSVRHRESFGIKGGMHSDFLARNCVIYDGGTAGIVTRWKTSKATVENCTIFGMKGKGVDEGHGRISAVNTLSMGNRQDFAIRRGSQSNNISSDATAAGVGSMVLLTALDQFVSIAPGAEDFHLKETSAAIDTGKNLIAATTTVSLLANAAGAPPADPATLDIDGTDRAEEAAWDIGADEVESAPEGVWFVDPSKAGNGTSWKAAFATLQQAMAAVTDGQEIWVKEGTYSLTAELVIDKPIALYGGFAGNERSRDQRDWRNRPTLLDAPDSGRCLSLAADGITVSGFVFSFGNTSNGGALMAQPSSRFTLEDCRFEANVASYGGAVYSKNAAGILRNCAFSGNMAKMSGGAVYTEASAVSIVNCIFSENTAGASASGTTGGGAVFTRGTGAVIANCTFSRNSTRYPANGGGAIYNFLATTVIANSILWGNTATVAPQVYNNYSSGTTIAYCDINQAGYETGNGNIRIDPLFVDPLQEDFHLQAGSPCIDAGSLDVSVLPESDFEGGPRLTGVSVDIGAYESD
ncbi:MAG: right-handed parallel beta-helix repeat-containing protein [Deltaproteobacteria bacterium]|nr:right-handed parallel beta-helix repeat-containing protein [Deltaproteobacteria bacterium]